MGKTDCRTAIAQLETLLETPGARQVEIAAALNHLRECPACKRRMGHLTRLLEIGVLDEDVLTCQECEELLPGYLTADGLGGADAPEWARMKRHLAACSHCTAAYASLADLVASAYGESGTEPPYYPEPNLSFLRSREPWAAGPATTPERSASVAHDESPPTVSFEAEGRQRAPEADLWQQTSRGLYRLAAAIPVLIGRAAASFGALVSPLTVQLAPIPVYRQKRPLAPAEEARDFLELLDLPHPETNVTLEVSLGPVFEGKGALALAVSTITPLQPVARARVTLRDADGGLLEGAFTDEEGVVLFRDLEVGEYLIRAEHAGQAWEFPLSLTLRSET